MTSEFSWQNSVSLCHASFCTPRPNFPVTPGISWLPTFAFQSLIMKRTSFLGVTSRRSCRSSQNHSTSDSSALLAEAQSWITVILNGITKSLQMVTAAMKLKDTCSLEEKLRPTSVQFSHSVASDSLRPHEPQHARPPYPSPTPRVHPNPCPYDQPRQHIKKQRH